MWCISKCFLVISSVLIVSVLSQRPLSPCPKVFKYVSDGQTVHGEITITPPYGKALNLTLGMDIPLRLPSNFIGQLELLGDKSDVLENLLKGNNLQYKVVFPVLDAIPLITSIMFNDRILCTGKRAQAPIVTPIQLFHNLKTNLPDNAQNGPINNGNIGNIPTTARPFIQNNVFTSRPPTNNIGVNPQKNTVDFNTQNQFNNNGYNFNQNRNPVNTNIPVNQNVPINSNVPVNSNIPINSNIPTNSNPFHNMAWLNQQQFSAFHKNQTETHNYQTNTSKTTFSNEVGLANRFNDNRFQGIGQQTFTHHQQSSSFNVTKHSEQHAFHVAGQQFLSGFGNNVNPQVSSVQKANQNNQPFVNYVQQPSILVPSYSAPSSSKKPIIIEDRPNPDTYALYGPEQTTINPVLRKKMLESDKIEIKNTCGLIKKPTQQITGSTSKIEKGSWPWLAAIFVKKISSVDFACSGILLSKEIVVTASHCLRQFNNRAVRKEEVVVKVGVHDLQDWVDENAKSLAVIDMILHPEFDENLALFNDLVLLRTSRVNFTDYIAPACLWSNNNFNNNIREGNLAGWGYGEKGQIMGSEPRPASQRFVSSAECTAADPTFSYLTTNTTFCTKTASSCNGDSGSGLLVNHNGRWHLRGVTSTLLKNKSSKNMCKISNYIIFTDILKYRDWIEFYLYN